MLPLGLGLLAALVAWPPQAAPNWQQLVIADTEGMLLLQPCTMDITACFSL